MTTTSISQFSTIASSNSDINGIDVATGWPPANIGSAFRELMAFLAQNCQGQEPWNAVSIDAASGTYRPLNFTTAGVNRWVVYADNAPESGGNAGSNFGINCYNDAGTFIATVLTINRATGIPTFMTPINFVNGSNAIDVEGGALTLRSGGAIRSAESFFPISDNTLILGGSSNRWQAVWAVNGTIQTSDPRLKDHIAPLPDALPIVAALNPVTFRWRDGGNGQPGNRTHWGFLAPDVKAAFESTGRDFGGYVRDENGTEHLRPDQLIPVLWKAIQELTQRVIALEIKEANACPAV